MLPVISLQVLSGWCHISSAAPAAVYVCGRKKKIPFPGISANFCPPRCRKARHQLAPEWRGSVHLLQILSTLRSLPPCLRFRGRLFPPVVKLNFCSSVNYTVNYRVEQTFGPGENKRLTSHIGFSAGTWCPQQQDSFNAVKNIRKLLISLLLTIRMQILKL